MYIYKEAQNSANEVYDKEFSICELYTLKMREIYRLILYIIHLSLIANQQKNYSNALYNLFK